MTIFDLIADSYDTTISEGRFSYSDVIHLIESFVISEPRLIADLASGTGNMAYALSKRWPMAQILCQEPSSEMVAVLKKKYPTLRVEQKSLEQIDIEKQDVVTVAFNSINYLEPDVLPYVFEKIGRAISKNGIFYFDALTIESAHELLGSKEYLEKTVERGNLIIKHRLTKETLTHNFYLENGSFEEHVQYLINRNYYEELVILSGMSILLSCNIKNTMRTQFVCGIKPIL